MAAIRPNAYGSSTIGVKKSAVCTIAMLVAELHDAGVVGGVGGDEHARVGGARQARDDRPQVGGGELAAAAGAV